MFSNCYIISYFCRAEYLFEESVSFSLWVQVVPAGGRGQSFTIKSRLAVGNTSLRFSDGADRVAPGTPVNFSETFR